MDGLNCISNTLKSIAQKKFYKSFTLSWQVPFVNFVMQLIGCAHFDWSSESVR